MLPNVLKVAEFFLSHLLADGGQTTTSSLKPLWKNGQSQWDQKSVCTQKKAKLEPLLGAGQGKGLGQRKGLPLQRESGLLPGTRRRGSFPHFPALPRLWDPVKFWFQKTKVPLPALLLRGDPLPIENPIKPNPCLRKNWNILETKHFWSRGQQPRPSDPKALNPSWLSPARGGSERGDEPQGCFSFYNPSLSCSPFVSNAPEP